MNNEEILLLSVNALISSRSDLIEKHKGQNQYLRNSKTDEARHFIDTGKLSRKYIKSEKKYNKNAVA